MIAGQALVLRRTGPTRRVFFWAGLSGSQGRRREERMQRARQGGAGARAQVAASAAAAPGRPDPAQLPLRDRLSSLRAQSSAGGRANARGELCDQRLPAQSDFYRAVQISYPNSEDLARAAALGVPPGGRIMIHGLDPALQGPSRRPLDVQLDERLHRRDGSGDGHRLAERGDRHAGRDRPLRAGTLHVPEPATIIPALPGRSAAKAVCSVI